MPELVHMDEDTLTHYGRLGMKWGQHIFGDNDLHKYASSRRARKATRALNKLDKKRAKYYFKAVQPSEKKYKRAEYKRIKAEQKGKINKIEKARNKEDIARNRYKDSLKEMEKGKKAINSLRKKIENNGQYDISSKETIRVKEMGKEYVAVGLISGGIGAAIYGAISAVNPENQFVGTKYKVRRKPQK